MGKPILCIPTYSRPDGLAIHRCKDLSLDKFLFIRPEEKHMYSKWSNDYKLVLQKDGTDIGKVRRNIVNYCNKNGFDWVYMFDDDLQKIERLGYDSKKSCYNSARILSKSGEEPRFEVDALKLWYRVARKHNLSLSSPNHRAYDRKHHGDLTLNRSAVIQCVLLHIPDVMSVGNYKSIRETGNEDYYIQYKLMRAGYNTGKIGLIEYDAPKLGTGSGGCNSSEAKDLTERYNNFITKFKSNVCDNERLVSTKTMKNGVSSLKFVWSGWEKLIQSQFISLKEEEYV